MHAHLYLKMHFDVLNMFVPLFFFYLLDIVIIAFQMQIKESRNQKSGSEIFQSIKIMEQASLVSLNKLSYVTDL